MVRPYSSIQFWSASINIVSPVLLIQIRLLLYLLIQYICCEYSSFHMSSGVKLQCKCNTSFDTSWHVYYVNTKFFTDIKFVFYIYIYTYIYCIAISIMKYSILIWWVSTIAPVFFSRTTVFIYWVQPIMIIKKTRNEIITKEQEKWNICYLLFPPETVLSRIYIDITIQFHP